jgi:hypothetical protein
MAENEADRLAAENKRLKAGMPPPDADPVGSMQAAFCRLTDGKKLLFAEWFSGSPYLKDAITMRHGSVPKYLRNLPTVKK